MKTFRSVFFAILAAALVIAVVISSVAAFNDYQSGRQRLRSLHAQNDELKRTAAWFDDQIRRADPTAPTR
jgi:type II secretory pathway component PulJ